MIILITLVIAFCLSYIAGLLGDFGILDASLVTFFLCFVLITSTGLVINKIDKLSKKLDAHINNQCQCQHNPNSMPGETEGVEDVVCEDNE